MSGNQVAKSHSNQSNLIQVLALPIKGESTIKNPFIFLVFSFKKGDSNLLRDPHNLDQIEQNLISRTQNYIKFHESLIFSTSEKTHRKTEKSSYWFQLFLLFFQNSRWILKREMLEKSPRTRSSLCPSCRTPTTKSKEVKLLSLIHIWRCRRAI